MPVPRDHILLHTLVLPSLRGSSLVNASAFINSKPGRGLDEGTIAFLAGFLTNSVISRIESGEDLFYPVILLGFVVAMIIIKANTVREDV